MEAIHPYGQNSKSLANEFCQTKTMAGTEIQARRLTD